VARRAKRRRAGGEWPDLGGTMPDDRRVLAGIDRLIVDGTNFIYAMSHTAEPLPPVALIGRLRAMVPPEVAVTVVLDGPPEHGLVSRRLASGVDVRHSGRFTADEVILRHIELAEGIRRSGGRTVRNGWLIDRLGRQRLSAPSAGRPSPPAPSAGSSSQSGSDPDSGAPEAPRWSPGRNATRKRGNPKRRPASGR
jgi:hypothetical protein